MYPIQSGNPFMVQQAVSGTGVFDGSEYGRAKCTFAGSNPSNPNNTRVNISARLYGTGPNAYTVAFVDPGVETPTTTVTQTGSAFTILLRRSPTVVVATAADVAEAINRKPLGIRASYGGDGNGVVTPMGATAITGLASGVDSVLRGPNNEQYIWFLPANLPAGFFYFEQEETITVRQFEAVFICGVGPYTVNVSRVNLDENLTPLAGEKVSVFIWDQLTATKPDIAFSDVGIILHPQQALVVETTAGLAGLVRFDVRKGARYPYL